MWQADGMLSTSTYSHTVPRNHLRQIINNPRLMKYYYSTHRTEKSTLWLSGSSPVPGTAVIMLFMRGCGTIKNIRGRGGAVCMYQSHIRHDIKCSS